MISWISPLAFTSMPTVGPSRMRMRGLRSIHLESTTRCWLPPESCLTGLSAEGVLIPSSVIHELTNPSVRALSRRPSLPRSVRSTVTMRFLFTEWSMNKPWTSRSSGT